MKALHAGEVSLTEAYKLLSARTATHKSSSSEESHVQTTNQLLQLIIKFHRGQPAARLLKPNFQ